MALFSNFFDIAIENKTNGFYIECGAADGEEGTNTLYFEINRNWKGNYLLTLSFNIPFMQGVIKIARYQICTTDLTLQLF